MAGQLPDNTLLISLVSETSNVVVTAKGTADSVADVAEQLGWLVTAFASSPVDQGITYYKPAISQLNNTQLPLEVGTADASIFNFAIHCDRHPSGGSYIRSDGKCWQNLFQNPVAVYGYPILRRPHHQPGLEIPLNIMAALLDEELVNTFQDRLYIKGFNAMLVPSERSDNLLLWHFLFNKDGTHISYFDSKAVETDEIIRPTDLETYRHIVGWCSDATYHAGEYFTNAILQSLS